MTFTEDKVPACRCTAHPSHESKRRWMKVVKEEPDYVVWCCQRCTEISKVPTIQVQFTLRGKAAADYANIEVNREKRRLLGTGKRPRTGGISIKEEES